MAKASVTITCTKCGATFVKEKRGCLNRSEADSWETWAENNFDLCPSCYGEQMQEEKKARGLLLSVRLRSPHNPTEEKCVALIYDGDTYSHKDALREMGATWTDEYPSEREQLAGGMFLFNSRQYSKRWVINCTPEQVGEFLKRSIDLGAEIIEGIDDMQLTTWAAIHNQVLANQAEKDAEKAEKDAAKAEKIKALGALPAWPEEIDQKWPAGANWNKKFYGKPGSWAIYLNNQKISISNELKIEMEKTLKLRSEWRDAVEKIERL